MAEGVESPPSPPPGREGESETRIEQLSSQLSARVVRFAEERAAGASVAKAAQRAGLSHKGGAPWRVLGRPEVAELVALLRERAGRDARVTLEGQIARVQKLGRDAEEAGDLGAALRAEDMINKLAGFYQPDVVVSGAPVQIVVRTGLPERDDRMVLVSPALPSSESALAELPPACVVPGDNGSSAEVTTPVQRELTAEELLS